MGVVEMVEMVGRDLVCNVVVVLYICVSDCVLGFLFYCVIFYC